MQLLQTDEAFVVQPYVCALRSFSKVVSACFGMTLDELYQQAISQFQKDVVSLGVNITLKLHTTFFHIPQFVEQKSSALGLYSEQAIESVHRQFLNHWKRFKRATSHPMYKDRLLSAVVQFNSKKISFKKSFKILAIMIQLR